MPEPINEPISVFLLSQIGKKPRPWNMCWRNRTYRFTDVGMQYAVRQGNTFMHIFTATAESVCFKLAFDTEALTWRLLEMEAG